MTRKGLPTFLPACFAAGQHPLAWLTTVPTCRNKPGTTDTTANLGFEAKLWAAADKLRNNMDAAEYKHVVLGLIFLKYISDAFEAQARRARGAEGAEGADPEDRDEYRAENIFWVPKEARWPHLQGQRQAADHRQAGRRRDGRHRARQPVAQGRAAEGLRPPRSRQAAPRRADRPGQRHRRSASAADRAKDILGRVYEYFLAQFASAEGKKGGQFYTPSHVVRVLVEMLAPYKGRVYDPCCGSGGMFVQSEKFVEAHGGKLGDISIYGQESNHTTWRLAKMNLAIRGIDAQTSASTATPSTTTATRT